MPLIRQIRIPLPPPDEQRRIVAVLGKALAGIATATANAQKNLTNARALFDAYLDATLNSENGDWCEQSIERCFRLKSGDGLTSGAMVKGPFPVFGGNGIAGYHNKHNLTGDNIIIGRVGALCGNARHIQGPIWLTDNAFKVLDKKFDIDNAFLCYLLNFTDLRSFARQTAQPVISNSSLKDVLIRLPVSVQHQKAIVVALDELQAKCSDFEAKVKCKLAALTELKQSLLQKAFTGELSAPISTTNSSVANDNFSTPQGTARIIAFAYRRHQMQNQQQTYGRVKAQKSLHLVESIGGIDLGRQPMKDAAGPNDFPHMLRAEEWAEAQGFFKFAPRASGNGYDFKKLANYDTLWADAVAATEPVAAALEKAIDPIVPMVSLDAEVFATVHAAWNNLIRDDVVITDDSIVKAARDDWHSAKLKIPEHKFRDAIRIIKAKNMEPDGSAKYVGGQVKLI